MRRRIFSSCINIPEIINLILSEDPLLGLFLDNLWLRASSHSMSLRWIHSLRSLNGPLHPLLNLLLSRLYDLHFHLALLLISNLLPVFFNIFLRLNKLLSYFFSDLCLLFNVISLFNHVKETVLDLSQLRNRICSQNLIFISQFTLMSNFSVEFIDHSKKILLQNLWIFTIISCIPLLVLSLRVLLILLGLLLLWGRSTPLSCMIQALLTVKWPHHVLQAISLSALFNDSLFIML
jgi:hypothetical protein